MSNAFDKLFWRALWLRVLEGIYHAKSILYLDFSNVLHNHFIRGAYDMIIVHDACTMNRIHAYSMITVHGRMPPSQHQQMCQGQGET